MSGRDSCPGAWAGQRGAWRWLSGQPDVTGRRDASGSGANLARVARRDRDLRRLHQFPASTPSPAAVRYILTNKKPWKELFVGRYKIDHTNNRISEDATAPALGSFGSLGWQKRYLGNAPDGLMLAAGYRTMQNVVGFKLIPSPQNGEGDATAMGRERAECRGCHFDSP